MTWGVWRRASGFGVQSGPTVNVPASGAWSPLDLGAKLLAWYDPDDISTLFQTEDTSSPVTTNGQNVGRVNDKSGNGLHLTQTTAGSRPVYNTTGLGASSPSIDFDGSADYLFNSAVSLGTTDKLMGASVLTIGASIAHADRYLTFFDSADTNDSDVATSAVILDYSTVVVGLRGVRNSTVLSNSAASTDTRYRVVSTFNGTNHVLTFNGTDQSGVASSGNFGASAGSYLLWGCGIGGGSPSNFWHGKGGPVVVTKGTNLTAGEMTNLDAYLAAY
jgi:hypothetical protein